MELLYYYYMRKEDFTLINKYHNFQIYLFSFFLLQYINIIKIVITINPKHFLYLKKFHILVQNKGLSMEKEYNYILIKNVPQIYKRKF
jgi:hypothetical protein